MKKALKWTGITVGGLIVLIIVLVIVCSRGTIFTGGVPLGGVTFTSGDIPGFPVYPGAVQSTESKGVSVPDDMRRVIPQRQGQWKRYLTADSPQKVLDWYDQAVPADFQRAQPRESGVKVFFKGGFRYGLYITAAEGRTNIILATGREE